MPDVPYLYELSYVLLGAALTLLGVLAWLGDGESAKERAARREHVLAELERGRRAMNAELARQHEAERQEAREVAA